MEDVPFVRAHPLFFRLESTNDVKIVPFFS